MGLHDDYDESTKMTPVVVSTIVAVTLFVAAILIVVLLLNTERRTQKPSIPTKEAIIKTEENPIISDSVDIGDIIRDSSLSPDDLDFWGMYPPEEETAPISVDEKPKETVENDPSTDGKHTLIKYADGKEEWLLINPYLPKHQYDYTKLVSQSNLMKYYVDGKQVSYVGTDISKYQDYVDFNKLKKAGVDYVMLRVGARGYGSGLLVVDEYFADNIKRATDAGLNVGVYFFSQAITKDEAIEEANMVLEQIKDYSVAYPIAFDMEYIENDTARVESLNKSDKTTVTKAFLDTIKAAGFTPMIYGNKEWLLKRIDLTKLAEYDIWLSQLGDVPDYPYQFSMWQYSNSTTIDGIAGYANLDISFIDYSEK